VFAQRVRKAFGVNAFLASEPRPKQVRRVAFSPGKGSSFIAAAAQAGCDVFVTGEAGYHAQLEGARRGVTVVELGHRESERFYLSTMKGWLQELGLSAQSLDQPTQTKLSLTGAASPFHR
jgi:putative NIF3 family GTP cyclohydrolase 1 type 2